MICQLLHIEYDDSDKVDHAASGLLLGVGAYAALRYAWPEQRPAVRFVEALVPIVLAAVAKEVYDNQHPATHDSDWRDALATTAGGAVGIAIALRF